jgi:hypothetical protein
VTQSLSLIEEKLKSSDQVFAVKQGVFFCLEMWMNINAFIFRMSLLSIHSFDVQYHHYQIA